MNTQRDKCTALYCRLSREDMREGESMSIENQTLLLKKWAGDNGFFNTRLYIDDGYSGKDFDRDDFQRMMTDIESGIIGVVITKDLSRLGRNYLESGRHRLLFMGYGVRYIAICDNYDSDKDDGYDITTPIKELMNEFYVADCSKKIKAAFQARGMSGKPTASIPPYGYLKSPEDKHKWVVDPEAAEIVRRIFRMTVEGYGPYQICCILKNSKVPVPGYHLKQLGVGLHKAHHFPDPYNWTSSTVCNILKKKEYLGHTVNFKSKKNSYRDKKNTYVPESEWVIFENTHEPVIDQETFDNVQRIRGNVKRRPDGWGYVHPLTGLLFCSDCGSKLYCHRIYNGKDKPTYVCGNYAKGSAQIKSGVVCETAHRIDATALMETIKSTLKDVINYAITDNAEFEKSVNEMYSVKQTDDIKNQKKRLSVCEKRITEIETLFKKIYEDNALGKLSDKRYLALSSEYEDEQTALENETAELKSAVTRTEDGGKRAAKFTALIKRYSDFEEMTVTMLNEFVEKIIVHERDRKGSADTTQKVEIHFNFIGEFKAPQPEIDPAVLAEQEEERRKIEARKDRLHENYMKRKANGKQKEWERKYASRRKAKKSEARAELLITGIGANAAVPLVSTAL